VPWREAVAGLRRLGDFPFANPAPRGTPRVSDAGLPGEDRSNLYICLSCWRDGTAPKAEGARTDGRRLFEAVEVLLAEMGEDAPVEAMPTLCFANCKQGCSAAIGAPGKWSYLLGRLGPEHAADLLIYAAAYRQARAGVVLPSGRPASLQHSVIARFPAYLDADTLATMRLAAMKDAAE
jgi:predicted metal-binding protein